MDMKLTPSTAGCAGIVLFELTSMYVQFRTIFGVGFGSDRKPGGLGVVVVVFGAFVGGVVGGIGVGGGSQTLSPGTFIEKYEVNNGWAG